MDKTQAIEIIKRARLMMKSTTTSDKTIQDYERIYHVITNNGTTSPRQKIENCTSRSTANKMRSAVRFVLGEDIKDRLSIQDKIQRTGQTQDWIDAIESMSKVMEKYEKLSLMQPKTVLKRRSKRQDIKGLPAGWQQKLIDEIQKKDRAALLVEAITGCRPAELVTGVKVLVSDTSILVTILGAKVSKTSGQPTRTLTYEIVPGLIQALSRRIGIGEHIVKIDDARRFSTSVRDAGKRAFPGLRRTLTPYCLRHQVASDMKASGLASDDVSRSLGHCSDKTATRYGHSKLGKGGIVPVDVTASREVKKSAAADLDRVKPMEKIPDPDFQPTIAVRGNSPGAK